jgi:hypothetical protein
VNNIQLIWEFRGPESIKYAEHHQIHLQEFLNKNQYINEEVFIEKIDDFLSIAYILTSESNYQTIANTLKPNKALKLS